MACSEFCLIGQSKDYSVELNRSTHKTGVMGSDFEKVLIGNTPLGRIGQPDDIPKVVTFLASEDAAWITGEKIAVFLNEVLNTYA